MAATGNKRGTAFDAKIIARHLDDPALTDKTIIRYVEMTDQTQPRSLTPTVTTPTITMVLSTHS
jgi:hypothetical protein